MSLGRAYALLEVKAIDEEQRIVEGIASTPSPDRGGDVMEPAGAKFSLPLPFLWFHDAQNPIGEVFDAKVTPDGIYIKARVSKVTKDSRLKTLVDEAWSAFTAKPPLVRGLSIGWNPLEAEQVKGGIRRVTKWIWGELSAVTIPMNTEATILAVKSYDVPAVSGEANVTLAEPAGVTAYRVVTTQKPQRAMTIQEQIKSFENTRAAKVAEMQGIQAKAIEEQRTKDAAEKEKFDELDLEIKSIDAELGDLRTAERLNMSVAKPVEDKSGQPAAAKAAAATSIVQVKSMAPKGTAFTRYAMALAAAKGDSYRALERARSYTDMPEVETMVKASLSWDGKAAVAAGTTTDATWAGPLAVAQPLVDEFLELLRPRTLIGRIPGFTQVPFNVSVNAQTASGTYSWVGQGNAKPVTSLALGTVSLGINKAAGIIVLTEELVKVSSPSAEARVREDMLRGMQAFLDQQLVDPAVAAVAGVNPASITNGATTAASGGATGALAKADLVAMVQAFTAAEFPLGESVFLMNESNAFALSISTNSLGQPLFPGFNGMDGGMLFGVRVVVTNAVSNRIVLVHTPSILFADDGGVNIDVSREASIQMDSAPTNPTDATTVLVSLWQRNLVGLRAERFITWLRARSGSVIVRTAAAYTGA